MGTGSSKSKAKGNMVFAADIVVPGQSKPMKVKGQVDMKDTDGGGSVQLSGAATVKQVAPNKFSLQMGSQKLGTFDVANGDGDFAAHLASAAQMTVTNIEMVAEDSSSNGSQTDHIHQPVQILLSQDTSRPNGNYSDDEDWEDVIHNLDAKENKPTFSEGAKERKARLKQSLLEKRTQLSQQEYEQMIANHKQEAELMALLREKERERQKFTLESKVAQRQQRRKARQVEKKEREMLSKHQVISDDKNSNKADDNQANVNSSSDEVTSGDAASAEQLERELQQREATFQQEMRQQRDQLTEAEYQRLVGQHRAEMEKLRRRLDRETDRQKQSLEDKLAERRRRKQMGEGSAGQPGMTQEEIHQLEADLKRRQTQLETELRDKKSLLSDEDYKKLIAAHKEELNKLQHTLDLQRERQRQSLLDKLAARQARRDKKEVTEESEPMTADEVKDLQLALNQKAMDFKKQLKDAKGKLSPEETQELIDKHRREMDLLQEQLDAEKERMRRVLLDKLEARRRKSQQGSGDDESPALTPEELKQLQLTLDLRDSKFKEDIRARRGKLSDEEYKRLMEQHKREQDGLAAFLASERERMERRMRDKMEARRFRIPTAKERNATKTEDVSKLEQEILQKEATFAKEVETKKAGMSEDEYRLLLAQHERDMERLKGRLAMATERQKRNFTDKLSERQRRKAQWQVEEAERMRLMTRLADTSPSITEEELDSLQGDISHYDNKVKSNIEARKGKVSDSEYKKMIEDHEKNVGILQSRLDQERERMQKVLEAKRAARVLKGSSAVVTSTHMAHSQEALGDSDDEADDFDQTDAVAIGDVSTQLWTTPTQSTSLVVVPLKEEYPVKRKRELYTNADIFRTLDAHAIKLAQTVSLVTQPSFSSLVNELVSAGGTELEKARLICRWITAQNCEEMDLNDVIDDTPLGVLKGLYHKKITFSTLFMRMCRFVGLRCVEINGCAKAKGYNPGQYITPGDLQFQHTWNAVRIDGYWHFVDCNWGVSHIQGSVAFDPFRFEYDEHYFLADPDVIIRSHFPKDPLWQLLDRPITLQDFNASVPLKPDFFKFGFELLSHTSAVMTSPKGEVDIRVQCPPGLILSTRLSTVPGGSEFSKAGVPYDQFDFIHQVAQNVMACYIRIPDPGAYYLTLYAKRQYLDGEINLETETEICRYLVHSSAPCQDQEPLPAAPADHWGPIGVMSVGLTPLVHRTAVVMTRDARDVEVGFASVQAELRFSHTLTSWGWSREQLVPYSVQRQHGDRLTFLVTPPKVGRYGLHIFARYPSMPTPVHVCSYLLVCSAVKPVVPPFPLLDKGEQWGPTVACGALGMSAFTHTDPFVTTADPSIQIVMGLTMTMSAMHKLMYYGLQRPHDASADVTPQFEGQSITYVLPLRSPGYYRFSILGKQSNDSAIPLTPLFHYLIRKT